MMNFFKSPAKIIIPALVALLIILPLVWWLASPLFRDDVVDEPLPFALPTQVAAAETIPTAAPTATATINSVPTIAPTDEPTAVPDETPPPTIESIIEPTDVPTAEPTAIPEPTATAAPAVIQLSSGTFQDADQAHKGAGNATIFQLGDERVLRFDDFSVTNGPDLHVLLVENIDGTNHDGIGNYVDLGSLKGNVGAQNYEIPAEVDLSLYEGVLIYCMPFHVVFSTALLQ